MGQRKGWGPTPGEPATSGDSRAGERSAGASRFSAGVFIPSSGAPFIPLTPERDGVLPRRSHSDAASASLLRADGLLHRQYRKEIRQRSSV